MTDALRTALVAALALGAGFLWYAVRTALIPVSSPERLVAELRLAQIGALMLALVGGSYIGFAAAHDTQIGAGLDIALAIGFFVLAASTLTRDPRQALTIVAIGFAAHAVIDVAQRPDWMPAPIVPRWYALGCALFNVVMGALCYFPILRR